MSLRNTQPCSHGLFPIALPMLRSPGAGIPHSIEGLGPDGCEFLLVFDDGSFDEDNTFLISDWFKHTPVDVLA